MADYESKNRNNDLSSWIFPIIMLAAFPPLGVLLLVLKVLDSGKHTRVQSRHPYYLQQEGKKPAGFSAPAGARTTAQSSAAEQKTERKGVQKILKKLAQKGKTLTIAGGIITAIFTVGTFSVLGDAAYWLLEGDMRWFLDELFGILPVLCFLAGGVGCLWAGLRKRKQVRSYRNYLAMIGQQQTISVSALASATGLSPARVRDDLADMLDAGLFPQGFLDYGGDRLVLSGDGLKEPAPAHPAPKPETRSAPPQEQENTILQEIREVNDAIDNEKLSAQIDRVGVITARILDYRKAHPEKAPQLHTFLSYYLPTTLKVLRAYAQLEDQEVAGENITASMHRIEGMMDKVVEGFEKQLDLLFQGDAMDIATDVEVLERMLAKDGLSDSQGLTLGI